MPLLLPLAVSACGVAIELAAKAHQRRKLERLCRYIARPAVATDRLPLGAHFGSETASHSSHP